MSQNKIELLARCAECFELLTVTEVEGSSLNKIIVTINTEHVCFK